MEKELLERVMTLGINADIASKAKKDADEELAIAEYDLINYMENREIKSTAKYEGLGWATLEKPKLFARCNAGDVPKMIKWVRDIERGDLVKETIHPSTLRSFVAEFIHSGGNPPEFVEYGFKSNIRVYSRP